MEIEKDNISDKEIKQILRYLKIAVVGLSKDENKPSHRVARYLKEHGYGVIPVNPTVDEVLGEKSFKNLLEIPKNIDIVDIFRRPEDILPVVKEAVEKKAKVVWMQEGIYNKEAADLAREQGLTVVWNRCMMKEHKRLM